MDNAEIRRILKHFGDFLPIGHMQAQYTHAATFNQQKTVKGVPMGWPENLVEEFCYTHIYGSFAVRNVNKDMVWDIPDDRIGTIVSSFLVANGDVKTVFDATGDEILIITC